MQIEFQVELMEINDFVPYKLNAKLHPEEQIVGIMQSIKDFRITQPAVVNKDNVIIIGHGRIEAAKRLGYKQFPVVRRDKLDDKEAHALRLLDNKCAEGEWDLEKLKAQYEGLPIDFEKYRIAFDFTVLPGSDQYEPDIGYDFSASALKQVILYYDEAEYQQMIDLFDAAMEKMNVENYSQVAEQLLNIN